MKILLIIKKALQSVMILGMVTLVIIFPEKVQIGGANSLNLFLSVVLPSIFPFMILMELLLQTKSMRVIEALLGPVMKPLFALPGVSCVALICGFFSGYPGGAVIAVRLREKGLISRKEGEHLMSFCNNASPAFICGVVGAGLLGNSFCGGLLLKSHILAGITVGLIFRFLIRKSDNSPHKIFCESPFPKELENRSPTPKAPPDLHTNREKIIDANESDKITMAQFRDAVYKSSKTMILIGTYIILFGILINILQDTTILFRISQQISHVLDLLIFNGFAAPDTAKIVLLGLTEISNGIQLIATEISNQKLPLHAALPLISMILGWGSVSVHMQVLSIVKSTDINGKTYILGKIFHGIISSIYTLLAIS